MHKWIYCVQSLSHVWLRLHGLQHAMLPCPSLSPGVCSNSMSVVSMISLNHLILDPPFLLLAQSFPASGSFSVNRLFASGGQSTGASASSSVLPINIQGLFPLRLTSLISLLSKGLSRVFYSITTQKHQLFDAKPSLWSNSHIHTWLLEEP